MAGIYHPSRGGVRGGKDQFNWSDVKGDKERENYLGHSVMAPTGKWQEGKDLIWYTRDNSKQEASEKEMKKRKELKAVKDLEARAMAAALGHTSFSTETTSLTAKELQEVLSRSKTDQDLGDRIQGVGHKESSSDKTQKSGMSFQGFNPNLLVDVDEEDLNESSTKKKKKKREKKKKKKKQKKQDSDDDYSRSESEHNKHGSYDDRTRHRDEYNSMRKSTDCRKEKSRDHSQRREQEKHQERLSVQERLIRHRSRSRSNERSRYYRSQKR